MRLQPIFGTALSLLAVVLSASSSPLGDAIEPEVLVVASFPESNPFGHVVNGEKNSLTLTVENKSGRNVTLISVAGSVHHPETNTLVKNLTSLEYGIELPEGVKLELPYAFYSEFKPGDLRLNVWLEHSADDSKYRVSAYDSIVTIVEPESSVFDFKLVSTYLITAALFGVLTYFAYLSFFPQAKKYRSKKAVSASTNTSGDSVAANATGGYQEEWIPEHHLKKPKTGKKASGFTSGTSGDELSGGDVNSSAGKRRKGKK